MTEIDRPGGARDAIRRIAEAHQLDPSFPAEVEREVEALLADPQIDDPSLIDLTDLPFVTIDHETSMDLDQAVFVDQEGDDHVIYYALADPAHYVRPGSALFAEALRRGASYYLPDLMIPMLPRPLSEGIISLNPNVDRRSMVFRMTVASDGECSGTRILAARIRSRAKLSFERVQTFLDAPEEHGFGDEEIDRSMQRLAEVGRVRMQDALDRRVVRYRRSEVHVSLAGRDGMRFVASGNLRVIVERYNEQMSLLCNVEGAQFLRRDGDDAHLQPIYRVHPPPEDERVQELAQLVGAIARAHGLPEDEWVWDRDGERTLADFLASLPESGPPGRIARAIHRQAVMINGRSCFRAEPGIHHGVGADVYARFSAPMREIVGVFLHKETWEKLRGESLATSPDAPDDDTLRELIVEAANRAKDTQRAIANEANRLVLDQLFGDDLGLEPGRRPARPGTVMGLNRGKVYLLLDDPPIDVKAYVSHLATAMKTDLVISEDSACLLRRDGSVLLRAGDAATVRVLGRDARRDRWRLAVERSGE